MEKHFGFLESLANFQQDDEEESALFCMPTHSGRFINSQFKDLLDTYGMKTIDGSRKALANIQGLEYRDGVLLDLGPLYHTAFSSQVSLFLQNGSSGGNHIVTLCLSNKKVLIQSNSHLSVHVGLQMSGSKIYYVQPDYDAEFDMIMPIKVDQVKEILETFPEIEAVYLTTPSSDGLCFDIKKMADIVNSDGTNRLLIIDETHGAHFYFSEKCPKPAMKSGADVSVTSIDKSLGGISASAILNIGEKSKIDTEKIKNQYMMMQTDSPSVFILSDVEGCIKTFSSDGAQMLTNSISYLQKIRQELNGMGNFKIAEFKDVVNDPTKLIIKSKGISGPQLYDLLIKRKIQVEKSTQRSVTITVHGHIQQSDVDQLIQALSEIDKDYGNPELADCDENWKPELYQNPLHKRILNERELVMDIRDCFARDSELIKVKDALGRISSEIKYKIHPAFLPVLLYGERINSNHIKFLDGEEEIKVVIDE